jgi:hypothetical protein
MFLSHIFMDSCDLVLIHVLKVRPVCGDNFGNVVWGWPLLKSLFKMVKASTISSETGGVPDDLPFFTLAVLTKLLITYRMRFNKKLPEFEDLETLQRTIFLLTLLF